jgi:hypothetical protein
MRLDLAPRPHAKLSASGAKRWMNCPGSVGMGPGSGGSTFAAAEGTLAHAIAAAVLSSHDLELRVRPRDFLGRMEFVDGFEVVCTQEMVDATEEYVETSSTGCVVEVDLTPALRRVHPDLGGTADMLDWDGNCRLIVADFKYGNGVFVEVENNVQLKIYALGVVLTYGCAPEEITLRIVQPRFQGAEPVREWTFPGKDLLEFYVELQDAAVRASECEDLVPGPWCRGTFCPHAASCPALERMHHALVAQEFETSLVDPATLGRALAMVDPLKAKIRELEKYAYEQATRGVAIPGWKLVEKRPVRRVSDEFGVVAWAEARDVDPYEKTVRSPAQLEKAYADTAPRGKKAEFERQAKLDLEPYVTSVSSGHALVPDVDKRTPVNTANALDFEAIPRQLEEW